MQLENLSAEMYVTEDINRRNHAEKILVALAEDPQSLDKCQLLLERASVINCIILFMSKDRFALVTTQQKIGVSAKNIRR